MTVRGKIFLLLLLMALAAGGFYLRSLAKRVFLGRFLLGSVPARMVQFTRRSPRFAAIIQDLFSGKQPYQGLKRRLLRNLNGSLYDIGMSLGFSRMVPRKGPA